MASGRQEATRPPCGCNILPRTDGKKWWGVFAAASCSNASSTSHKSELSAAGSRISLVANQLVLVKEAVHRPLILIPLNATRLDDRLRD